MKLTALILRVTTSTQKPIRWCHCCLAPTCKRLVCLTAANSDPLLRTRSPQPSLIAASARFAFSSRVHVSTSCTVSRPGHNVDPSSPARCMRGRPSARPTTVARCFRPARIDGSEKRMSPRRWGVEALRTVGIGIGRGEGGRTRGTGGGWRDGGMDGGIQEG